MQIFSSLIALEGVQDVKEASLKGKILVWAENDTGDST